MRHAASAALMALAFLLPVGAMAATEPVKFTATPTIAEADGKTTVSFNAA